MGTNGSGNTEWERDFDPKTEKPYPETDEQRRVAFAAAKEEKPRDFELVVARAINEARYDIDAWRDGAPPYIKKTFEQEDRQTQEYVLRLARAALRALALIREG